MSLKAVLFDFNGVIINDERIHLQLIDEILIEENLQPQKQSERQACLGRSDRACFQELLSNRGRVSTPDYLHNLLRRKAQAYVQELDKIPELPLYPGVREFITSLSEYNLHLGLVTGAIAQEVELILQRANLREYFRVIVTGDDINGSKPQPDRYLLAVKQLQAKYPDLHLQCEECLAIEDVPAGIRAAKAAQIPVLGVANTYPLHLLQRWCNWAVDELADLELSRVQTVYAQKQLQPVVSECEIS